MLEMQHPHEVSSGFRCCQKLKNVLIFANFFSRSKRPLQRMVVGGVFASGAFVMAAFVQSSIDSTLPVRPSTGNFLLSIMNVVPEEGCTLDVTSSFSALADVETAESCRLSISNLAYLQQSNVLQFSIDCVSPTTTDLPFFVTLQCQHSPLNSVLYASIAPQFVQSDASYTIYIGMSPGAGWDARLVSVCFTAVKSSFY